MDRTWIDPRNGKEWRVHFTWTGNGAMEGPSAGPSVPVAWFYHLADPDMKWEIMSVARQGDDDLDAMTDQELMDLIDEAREREV